MYDYVSYTIKTAPLGNSSNHEVADVLYEDDAENSLL
jgi:hypothetical protein